MKRLLGIALFAVLGGLSPWVLSATTLGDLSWLAGSWQGKMGEGTIEETWSRVDADAMLGMFRWTNGGEVIVYEVLLLTQEDSAVLYRFKHFDAELVGWEDKDRPITLELADSTDRVARFVETAAASPMVLTYQRRGRKGLRVTLTSADGAVTEFDYRRKSH